MASMGPPPWTRTFIGPAIPGAAASYAGGSAIMVPLAERGADMALRPPGGGIGLWLRPEEGGMLLGM